MVAEDFQQGNENYINIISWETPYIGYTPERCNMQIIHMLKYVYLIATVTG